MLRIDYREPAARCAEAAHEAALLADHGGAAPAATSSRASRSPTRCSARGWSVSWLGTRARHGEPARAAARHRARHDRTSAACAARACCTRCRGALRLLGAFWHCLAHHAPRAARRGARHGRLRLLSRRADGVAAAASRWCSSSRRGAAAEQPRAAAGRRPRRVRLPGDAAQQAKRAIVTGNPVRARDRGAAARRPSASPAAAAPLRLLVVGGSLGAQVLNDMRAAGARAASTRDAAAARHAPDRRKQHIDARARRLRRGRRRRPRCCPSSTTWRARLAECDVIVCRAGAITVSELCAAGVAARAGAARRQHDLAPARQRRSGWPARGAGDPPAAGAS